MIFNNIHIILCVWCITIVAAEESHSHPLHQKLKTWHILSSEDVRFHRHKRSIDEKTLVTPLDHKISFDAFNRTFSLSLMPSTDVFAPKFKAYIQLNNGSQELYVDKGSVMKGKVLGDSASEVTAHLNGKLLTANIQTKEETYVVEPLWRHMPKPSGAHTQKSLHTDMIVYRESDLTLAQFQDPHSKEGFCDTENLMKPFRDNKDMKGHFKSTLGSHDDSHHREKRSTNSNTRKICKLTLVADHRFYKEMGNSSALETTYYLINLIERVNKIYKNTQWDSGGYSGYGFRIENIIIHNDSSSQKARYNEDRYWEAKELLEAFSEYNYSSCLSHLFTYVDFAKGLLGLAYVGSEKTTDLGGICTKPYDRGNNKPRQYLNTGLTSTINWGQKILTTEADLVTAHELGHNFGAEHDDDTFDPTIDCTPGQSHNGNFIMYPAAVSGLYPNNKKFSECSKRSIFPSLLKKAPICFQEDNLSFCGNYQVEKDDNETCDVGYGYLTADDRCCRSNCTLKEGAKCSNKNYPCCTEDCQVASKSKLCRAHIPNLCYKDTFCDGINFECPGPEPVADNEPCGDLGKCKNGQCVQFCHTKGMQPCLCSSSKDEYCYRCCAPLNVTGDARAKNCKPYVGNPSEEGNWPQLLPDNSTCSVGYCSKGVCQKHLQDVIERVWDIFQHIAPDKIGEFLADNIVGAVLVFSLLFWIPCSCLVNFVDKKRLKERQKEEKWFTEKGGEFSRSSMFRGVGGGSAPATPRIRIQRNNPNWISSGVARAGFEARDQWRASQERGMAIRKSTEQLNSRLAAVPGSPNKNGAISSSNPSLSRMSVNNNSNRESLTHTGGVPLSKSHPSLTSPLDSSNEKLFDNDDKPIAVSSTTDLSLPVFNETNDVVIESDRKNSSNSFVLFRRPGLHRQGAVTSQ